MAFTPENTKKIKDLIWDIEGRKCAEDDIPTYLDSENLKEIFSVVKAHLENENPWDESTLNDALQILFYLATSYDAMCRAGESVKIYPLLLKVAKQAKAEDFEDILFLAIRARNFYVKDECKDLLDIAQGVVSEEIALTIYGEASIREVKNDPVEMTEEYLAVIDEIERKIAEHPSQNMNAKTVWQLKAKYLSQKGIKWKSPLKLNPEIDFCD